MANLTTVQDIPFEWKPGDVILDLYEVRTVTEGFGDSVREKGFHEGGFGRVYKVWHRTWRREMAVKTPRAHAFSTREQKTVFTRECETWIGLGLHPHIAACHYIREIGGAPRIFSEYATAGTLEDWVQSKRLYQGDEKTVLARVIDIAIQFARGLSYAHDRGVIHQDVKPLNALMWDDGTLKVTDFGIAGARLKSRITKQADEMHSVQVSTGGMTPAYCSPEQAAGLILDRRTDIWSWAASVLQMFVGEVTWRSGALVDAALDDVMINGPAFPHILPIPQEVALLLRHCLQRKAQDRPHSLAQCCDVLQSHYQQVVGQAYCRSLPSVSFDSPDNISNRALSLVDLGYREEAQRMLLDNLKRDKHHLPTVYNLGLIRWRNGSDSWRANESGANGLLVALGEIAKDSYGHIDTACLLGWIHAENAHYTDAVACFTKAASAGNNPDAVDGREAILPYTTRETAPSPTLLEGHTERVTCLDISSDGQLVLSGSRDHTVRLWSSSTSLCVQQFCGHSASIRSVALSPDGRHALSAGDDHQVILWDTRSGAAIRRVEERNATNHHVSFSVDGETLVSESKSKTIVRPSGNELWQLATLDVLLYDAGSGTCTCVIDGKEDLIGEDTVHAAALSPNGREVVSLWLQSETDCTVRIHDIESREDRLWSISVLLLRQSMGGRFAIYSPGGQYCVLLMDDELGGGLRSGFGILKLWHVATGSLLFALTIRGDIYSERNGFAACASGASLCLVPRPYSGYGRPVAPWYYCCPVSVVDVVEHQELYKKHLEDAESLLARGQDAEALTSLRLARTIPGHERDSRRLRLSAKAGLRAKSCTLAGAWLAGKLEGHKSPVIGVAFSADGSQFVSASGDGSIRIWNLATRECIQVLDSHSSMAIALSPDGRQLVSGSNDRKLRLWDLASGRCVCTVDEHPWSVNQALAFSPDGRLILSSSHAHVARGWETATGRLAWTIERHTSSGMARALERLAGLNGRCSCKSVKDQKAIDILSLAVSPSGRYALFGSCDGVVSLWAMSTQSCIRLIQAHDGGVHSVGFMHDERTAISGSTAFDVKLWDLKTGACVRSVGPIEDGIWGSFTRASFGHRGQYMFTTGKELKLWDLARGECVRVFERISDDIMDALAVAPDGRYVAAGDRGTSVSIWELDWEYEF